MSPVHKMWNFWLFNSHKMWLFFVRGMFSNESCCADKFLVNYQGITLSMKCGENLFHYEIFLLMSVCWVTQMRDILLHAALWTCMKSIQVNHFRIKHPSCQKTMKIKPLWPRKCRIKVVFSSRKLCDTYPLFYGRFAPTKSQYAPQSKSLRLIQMFLCSMEKLLRSM